jgi:hypothetical protein
MNDPEYEDAQRRVRELAFLFTYPPLITEAELAVRGLRPVSVVHGYGEEPEEAMLIYCALPELARGAGQLAHQVSGGGFTTYVYTGPGADKAVTEFIAAVRCLAPRWWRITATAHPVWQVDWRAGT